jgi:hypothetical protein
LHELKGSLGLVIKLLGTITLPHSDGYAADREVGGRLSHLSASGGKSRRDHP